MLFINDKLQIPLRELHFSFVRSQGPGGQNVNKVNTKAVLRWRVTSSQGLPAAVRTRFLNKYANRITKGGELVLTSQRYRDRGRNIADCLEKLRQLTLAVATPPKKRKPTKPSAGSEARRRRAKDATSKRKQLRQPPRWDD